MEEEIEGKGEQGDGETEEWREGFMWGVNDRQMKDAREIRRICWWEGIGLRGTTTL